MDTVFIDFLSLCFRWLHMIAGMAWIGASFYFIHLDLMLKPDAAAPEGAQGTAWEVHGGGFYQVVKFMVAPPKLPSHLAWFKWEAYTTWLSGFSLLVVTFYLNADLFLIDPSVLVLSPAMAITASLAGLAGGWIAYEALCRSPLGENENLLAAIGFVFLVALFYGFSHIFSGRGTFIEMGALIGTIMVANVFMVIIPNQKKMVAAMIAHQAVDPRLGAQGKQRSVHNNYLTLPVVFLMIGNHYPLMFDTSYSVIIFAIVLLVGFLIRYFYTFRHAGKPNPWWVWGVVTVLMVVAGWLSWMGSFAYQEDASAAPRPHATFAEAEDIVMARCTVCHSPTPVWPGIAAAPKGLYLDTAERIRTHAALIELYAVTTHAMPPANVTELSDDDRRKLGAGLAQLAMRR